MAGMLNVRGVFQTLADIAFVPIDLAPPAFGILLNWFSVIRILNRKTERNNFSLMIGYQVKLVANKPAIRGLASLGTAGKYLVGAGSGKQLRLQNH